MHELTFICENALLYFWCSAPDLIDGSFIRSVVYNNNSGLGARLPSGRHMFAMNHNKI